jgi:ABC-type branched-subunit amino acid transport system substrate-binding protein
MMHRVSVSVLLLVGVIVLTGRPTHAQEQDAIPEIPDAERTFEQGLTAFERGKYGEAAERFRLVTEYELNRKTTAALLMGGKALVRAGRYQDAIDRLRTLLDRHPTTTYRDQAESILALAQRGLQRFGQDPDTLRVGVALPMGDAQLPLSQALFNGIRLAVEEHNGVRRRYAPAPDLPASADTFEVYSTSKVRGDSLAREDGETTVATPTDTVRVDSLRIITERVERPDWVAKTYLRRVGERPETARAAIDSLVRIDNVDVIVGPIRSEMARPAGGRAEQARVLLVAPVATNDTVSRGRNYVFQANPTFVMRGRLMARFAKDGLLLDRVGMIYEPGNSYSARMAEGFRAEVRRQNMKMPLSLRLQNSQDWSRLPTLVNKDSTITDSLLARPEAFYLPVAGENTAGKIRGALTGLRTLAPDTRALGNGQWHNLPFAKIASKLTATYANNFYVDTKRPAVQRFIKRHRLLTGTTPGELSADGRRLAYAGYDVAHFLLSRLSPTASRLDPRTLRAVPAYEGLGTRIDFGDGNVNQALFFHRYRNQQLELLQ